MTCSDATCSASCSYRQHSSLSTLSIVIEPLFAVFFVDVVPVDVVLADVVIADVVVVVVVEVVEVVGPRGVRRDEE